MKGPYLRHRYFPVCSSSSPAVVTRRNSLFMPSQLALAIQAGLSLPAVAALQHVSAPPMGLFSPIRMSITAGLFHGAGQERIVYLMLLPYAACSLALFLGAQHWSPSRGRPP